MNPKDFPKVTIEEIEDVGLLGLPRNPDVVIDLGQTATMPWRLLINYLGDNTYVTGVDGPGPSITWMFDRRVEPGVIRDEYLWNDAVMSGNVEEDATDFDPDAYLASQRSS